MLKNTFVLILLLFAHIVFGVNLPSDTDSKKVLEKSVIQDTDAFINEEFMISEFVTVDGHEREKQFFKFINPLNRSGTCDNTSDKEELPLSKSKPHKYCKCPVYMASKDAWCCATPSGKKWYKTEVKRSSCIKIYPEEECTEKSRR